jgi:N-acetylglucosamine malate deacetylase 2
MLSFCIITPSHIGDIEQFSILRQSLQLFAPDIPHLAIVHSEDCQTFSDRFGAQPNLHIIASADVLPPSIERRRSRRDSIWLHGIRLPGRLMGWYAQQLAKIFTLAHGPYEAAVFIDSDVFLCHPVRQEDFYVGGNLKLYRRPATNAEQIAFDLSTHEILGVPAHKVTGLQDFIFQPATFKRSTARRLLEEFRLRRRGRKWLVRFLGSSRPSEYNLLGWAATVLEGTAGYHVVECNPEDLHHSIRHPEDVERIDQFIDDVLSQPKAFALMQSWLRIDHRLIVAAFDTAVRGARERTDIATSDLHAGEARQPPPDAPCHSGWPLGGRTAVVVAHPDDETLALGGQLHEIPYLTLIHVTDGAPHQMADAIEAGFSTREAYAAARAGELDRALAAGGVRNARRIQLGITDQEAPIHLADLVRTLVTELAGMDTVVTHPYEGGHPDHDACAFAVQLACAILTAKGKPSPQRAEFASYHARDGQLVTGVFWPAEGCPEQVVTLDSQQLLRKQAALAHYVTQRAAVALFRVDAERLRPAPSYDFTAPPPPQEVYYDGHGWSMNSVRWRQEALGALRELGFP